MRVVRRQAFQAHAVPDTAGYPKGPFSSEVLAPPIIDHEPLVDDHVYPYGATAQNKFLGVQRYQCRDCGDVLMKEDLQAHDCGAADGED